MFRYMAGNSKFHRLQRLATATIVPVPKNSSVSSLNDCRCQVLCPPLSLLTFKAGNKLVVPSCLQLSCQAKLTSCWLWLNPYHTIVLVVSIFSSNSPKQSEYAYIPKRQTFPLSISFRADLFIML